MTRRPTDPDDLEQITRELEGYASRTAGEQPHDLADRVMLAVADEPTPRRGLLAALMAPFGPGGSQLLRGAMVAGTMAAAVLAVVLAGQLGALFEDQNLGPSPQPSPSLVPVPTSTPSPSPSTSPTATERPTRSPRPSEEPSGSARPSRSAEPSDDETPEPSDDDNSGPGGGDDDDNSGPGSGSDGPDASNDSSGPGGGDD